MGGRNAHPSGISMAAQGNRMNKLTMVRKRSPFHPSPDKGRTGGVCGSEIRLLRDSLPQTSLNPPLSGGKWVGDRFLPYQTVSCVFPAARRDPADK
jgi:hypothetical protein